MTEPPDDLARRFAAALPETGPSECPPADTLWAAAAGELPFAEVRALTDHGARCASCAEAWRILADVRHEAEDAGALSVPAPSALAPRPFRRRALVPVAAAALAALGVWVTLRQPPPAAPPVERGTPTPAVRAESAQEQPAREAVLRWSEVPGASSYNVTVLTPDLVVVHQAVGVARRELALPDALRRRAAEDRLLWNVDAVLPDGRTVASPTFELRLRGR